MANDRMYIRCKGCGDLHYLAKCYDDGYFTTHEGEELRQGLDDFFDRHKWCYRHKYYGGFELVYESDEDSESEDERIRRKMIDHFKAKTKETWCNMPVKDIIAYLEKQKEPENTSASTIAPSCWAVEQKEQKPKAKAKSPLSPHELYDAKIEGISQGRQDVLDHPEQFGLQKPAEWSEEDEDMLNSCISSIEEAKENRYAYRETDGDTSYDHEISWLKSLRPSWKPSKEQMEALEAATVRYQSTGLESLYEELKKL